MVAPAAKNKLLHGLYRLWAATLVNSNLPWHWTASFHDTSSAAQCNTLQWHIDIARPAHQVMLPPHHGALQTLIDVRSRRPPGLDQWVYACLQDLVQSQALQHMS